jgi:hypothetical protein
LADYYYIPREAAYAFFNGIKYQEMKQQLCIGSDRMLNEAFNQVLNLEATIGTQGLSIGRLSDLDASSVGHEPF